MKEDLQNKDYCEKMHKLLCLRNKIFNDGRNNLLSFESKFQNGISVKYAAKMSGIGIANPSLIRYNIDKGLKKGRITNSKPKTDNYTKLEYDSSGSLIRITKFNEFGCESTWYFHKDCEYTYAVPFFRDTDRDYQTFIYRYSFDNGMVKDVAMIDLSQVLYEEYDYSLFTEGIIICNLYEYLEYLPQNHICSEKAKVSSKLAEYFEEKEIVDPIADNEYKLRIWEYKIMLADNKIIQIDEYKKTDGQIIFNRSIFK